MLLGTTAYPFDQLTTLHVTLPLGAAAAVEDEIDGFSSSLSQENEAIRIYMPPSMR